MSLKDLQRFYNKNDRAINLSLLLCILILCTMLRNWLALAGFTGFLYYYGVTTQ